MLAFLVMNNRRDLPHRSIGRDRLTCGWGWGRSHPVPRGTRLIRPGGATRPALSYSVTVRCSSVLPWGVGAKCTDLMHGRSLEGRLSHGGSHSRGVNIRMLWKCRMRKCQAVVMMASKGAGRAGRHVEMDPSYEFGETRLPPPGGRSELSSPLTYIHAEFSLSRVSLS